MSETFGISEFIATNEGFFGIIKQRFSDFQVNEVTLSGEVVHLTSEEVVPIPPVYIVNKDIQQPPELQDDENELLKYLSGQKQLQEISPSIGMSESSSGSTYNYSSLKYMDELRIRVGELTKDRRTVLHQYIKSHFPNLNSTTKEIDNEKVIHVTKRDSSLKQDKRNVWPKLQNHVHFVLHKENIDTIEAINRLAGKLRLKPGMFSYAGTKDRRAKTSQLVSVYQVSPENLASAAQAIRKIHIGNFSFANKCQRLGQAKGNSFKVVLREVKGSEKVIKGAIKSLEEKGFINYFGMQRFSTSNVSTHEIGKNLLLGKWDQAVKLILSPRENDEEDLVEAKKIWAKDRDALLAYETLNPSKRTSIEGQLFLGLSESNSKNLLNALERIPRNIKLLYIHAYQSYIWNHVVSRRIQKYGLKVLPGDLVRNTKTEEHCKANPEGKEGHICCPDDQTEDGQSTSKCVHALSAEEADDTTEITKVVMPLPGFTIVYPDNEIKGWYLEFLQKDNLAFESFKSNVKTFSLGGAYRQVILRPQDLKYNTCFYNDANKSLIQSDLDALENEDPTSNQLSSGANKAMILQFFLPSSAYATMLVRELLKIETMSKYHSSLNSTKRKCEEETGNETKKLAVE